MTLALVLVGLAACDARTGVQGTITNNKGEPIAGVTVRLILVNTGRTAQTNTGPDGKFSVELIHGPFSRLELVASMSGFEDYHQEIQAKTAKTIQIALTPQSVLEQMFPNVPKKAETVECFRSFTPDTSIRTVVEKCGRPDEETGSGLYIFVWNLPDKSSVAIGTSSLERIYDITYTDTSRKSVSLLAPKQ